MNELKKKWVKDTSHTKLEIRRQTFKEPMNRVLALIVAVILGTWFEVKTWIKWIPQHRGKITYYEYRRFDDLAEDYQR